MSSKTERKLPKKFYKYFWDTDPNKIDVVLNKSYVIKRLIDRGDTSAIKWLLVNYSGDEIGLVVKKYRDISRKTAVFWSLVMEIDEKEVVCLQKPYQRLPFQV